MSSSQAIRKSVWAVMDQTGASEEKAKNAIHKSEGDLAKAIMDLKD